jgi:hypothetical protein
MKSGKHQIRITGFNSSMPPVKKSKIKKRDSNRAVK